MRMSDDAIRTAIVERLFAAAGGCGDVYIAHQDGVIRGLLLALTGKDHGTHLTMDVASILEIAHIQYKRNEDGTITPILK